MDDEPSRRRRRASLALRVSLTVAVFALVAGGLLAGRNGRDYQQSVHLLEHSTQVVDSYFRMHQAFAVLDRVEDEYPVNPTLAGRQTFRSADRSLVAALAELAELGSSNDRRLAAEVESARRRFIPAMEREFELVAEGASPAALEAYDDEVMNPLSERLAELVNTFAPLRAGAALDQIAQLREAAGRSLVIALALVISLATVFAGLLIVTGVARHRRRLMKQALDSTERRYRLVLETGQDAYVAFDASGAIRDWNGRAAELFGLTRAGADAVVQDFIAEQEPADSPLRDLLPTLAAGASTLGEPVPATLRRADGSTFAAEVSVWATESAGSRFFNALVRDVETRLRLEEQLRQAQKMEAVGRLAGGIAHDFNNLLTVIAGSSELARYELDDEHPARLEIDQVIAASSRGSALTRQLLTFSRQRPAALVDVHVDVAIAETGELLARLVGSSIDFRIAAGADTGYVQLEEGQLDQILFNLVINARDAIADEPGSITVDVGRVTGPPTSSGGMTAAPPGDWVRLQVHDTGAGMDAATRARIFEPFFTTKAEGVGTGLGLATIYAIVTQAGGQLTVGSEPGEGTTFTIYLPRAVAPGLTVAA